MWSGMMVLSSLPGCRMSGFAGLVPSDAAELPSAQNGSPLSWSSLARHGRGVGRAPALACARATSASWARAASTLVVLPAEGALPSPPDLPHREAASAGVTCALYRAACPGRSETVTSSHFTDRFSSKLIVSSRSRIVWNRYSASSSAVECTIGRSAQSLAGKEIVSPPSQPMTSWPGAASDRVNVSTSLRMGIRVREFNSLHAFRATFFSSPKSTM
mmetsp:Transcript_50880/g.134433  ORF Transcript_50880/g.134433 Transcript_50880/m.134433 type:complete len:217 (-) Transcript_50880:325-975(-)